MTPAPLSPQQVAATAGAIAAVQLPSGLIPWFPGGHADPWNHVEAAMALGVAGRVAEAGRAFEWLLASQQADGSWAGYYVDDAVEDPRRDSNVSSYVAVGTWHHFRLTADRGFLETMWPALEAAVGFALGLQRRGGEVLWADVPDGSPLAFALLTGSSSVLLSLRCALAAASALGRERPEWELAAARLGDAVAHRRWAFEPKDRWAMDWYYPVLCGAVRGPAAAAQLASGWERFVMDGLGVRCVSDQPWVTAAETAECALALDAAGLAADAHRMLAWVQHLREDDGSDSPGCVHPEGLRYPGGERTTYSAAAVLLAADALGRLTPAGGLFRGEGLPVVPLGVEPLAVGVET